MPLFHAVALTFTCAATPVIVFHGTPKSQRIERSTIWRTKVTAEFVPALLKKIEMPLPDHVSFPPHLNVPATVCLCYQDRAAARKLYRVKRVEAVVIIGGERVRVAAQFSKAKNTDLRKAIKETGVIIKRDVTMDLTTAIVVGELLKEKRELRAGENERNEQAKENETVSVQPASTMVQSVGSDETFGSIRNARRYSARLAAKVVNSEATMEDVHLFEKSVNVP